MDTIRTRRDYHLTRFKIDTFLAKGFSNLSPDEIVELKNLSKEMSKYEHVHFPTPVRKVVAKQQHH